MKKRKSVLFWVTMMVICFMGVYWITYDVPEWFRGGELLFDIMYRLSQVYLIIVVAGGSLDRRSKRMTKYFKKRFYS